MAQTAKEAYEALLTTLFEEKNRELSERDQQYFNDTLNLFNKAGETDSDHHLWRHQDMIQAMISILINHERNLNPWKYEIFSSDHDPAQDPEPYINVEVFPSIARKDLELMAAQEYIKKTKGILIPLPNPTKKADHLNIPRDTLRKKCERIAKDHRAGSKKLPCPVYPDDEKFKFAVIKISDNPKEKTKGMLFQKIVDSKED